MAQEFDGVDDLTGLVEISQPSLKYRSIVGIAREAIYHQIDVLFRRVLEWERTGIRRDGPFVEGVVVKINVHFACDAEFVGFPVEGENGDGIIVDVAQPTHFFRLDINARFRDMSIVPLTGPHHRSVGAECDGLILTILCLMDDADAFHDSTPSAERVLNTMVPGGGAMSECDPAPAQYSRSSTKQR